MPKSRSSRPISAWLEVDETLDGDVAIVAEDLYRHVFKSYSEIDQIDQQKQLFLGVAPWTPLARRSRVEDSTWTIIPVKSSALTEFDIRSGSVCVSGSCHSMVLLKERMMRNPYSAEVLSHQTGFEVQIVDVMPPPLETVYVAVDGDALDQHDRIQSKFAGGFRRNLADRNRAQNREAFDASQQLSSKYTPNGANQQQDDYVANAIRAALDNAQIVRQNDWIQLPLPAHPITHKAPPPVQIVLCQPVKQGRPVPTTRIVVNRSHHLRVPKSYQTKPRQVLHHFASSKSLTDFDTSDGNGSLSEDFHSAAEEDSLFDSPSGSLMVSEASERDDSSSEDSDQDLIAMTVPSILTRPSGILSATTVTSSGTARARTHRKGASGSVFSNMTATTTRQNAKTDGTVCQVASLTRRVAEHLLFPRPNSDEDEESRVYVDIKSLKRVGCFSGDWIRISESTTMGEHDWSNLDDTGKDHFRVARIYGLSGLQSSAPARSAGGMPKLNLGGAYMASNRISATTVWLSPFLSANLKSPKTVRISPLFGTSSMVSPGRFGRDESQNAIPPTAQELILNRISTPLATEKGAQPGVFAALKSYFEAKSRVLVAGDSIALPVNIQISRLISQTSNGDSDDEEELLVTPINNCRPRTARTDIVWLKVGRIVGPEPMEASDLNSNMWSGAFIVDPKVTRLRQSGAVQSKIPSTLSSAWKAYVNSDLSSTECFDDIGCVTNSPRTPFDSDIVKRLQDLMDSASNSHAIGLGTRSTFILLQSNQRSSGKVYAAHKACMNLGLHCFVLDASEISVESSGNKDIPAEALLTARVERALSCGRSDTAVILRHAETLSADRLVSILHDSISKARIFIATTSDVDSIPDKMRSLFTHEMEMFAPDETEREAILRNIVQDLRVEVADDIDFASIAVRTAALVAGNLLDIVERASDAQMQRLEHIRTRSASQNHPLTYQDILISGSPEIKDVTNADFDLAVNAARENFADAIGAPKIPNVSWDDVGGLESVKGAVMETIQLPLEHPELFVKGMKKRSGILFYGPPGTGKTLLAKAIATEFSLNFFSVKGPELLNMYIGESEANVRRVFQKARDARPCVVFFDELDSVAPKRGNQGDSGGVMDRIVSQLLAELDGMTDGDEGKSGGVFVIGATNRPDLLDQALLRPGRFDKMLYLGVSDTHQKQLTILQALTRKFTLDPALRLAEVAERLPFTYTGADLYALCSDAMLKAVTRQSRAIDDKVKAVPGPPVTTAWYFDHIATADDIAVIVTARDFADAQQELVSSVSAKELEHYQRVRQTFERLPENDNFIHRASTATQDNSHRNQSTNGRTNGHIEDAPPQLNGASKGKGKGKASAYNDEFHDTDDDDDDAYVTSNDHASPSARDKTNGYMNSR